MSLYLNNELNQQAIRQAEDANEIAADDRAGVIEAFIRRKLPADWYDKSLQERTAWFRIGHGDDFEGAIRREYICGREIAIECFGKDMTRYEMKEINQMLHRMPGLKWVGPTNTSDKAYGCQRRYKIMPEFWRDNVADDLV